MACTGAQSCPTICEPRDFIPPGSSVNGILQARILEWVAISTSRGFSWPRDWNCVSCIGMWILYHWATCLPHDIAIILLKKMKAYVHIDIYANAYSSFICNIPKPKISKMSTLRIMIYSTIKERIYEKTQWHGWSFKDLCWMKEAW